MSYHLWQQRYGADPFVIGGVFTIDDEPFTVVGITPPSFFGDALRSNPPDFFLPLGTEPLVGAAGDIKQSDLNWLDLIGRIRSSANPASVEAHLRVELKQWLRSHWGEMSANERAAFPDQTLFLRPGGAGITSMREEYEHWLEILMMVSAFALFIVCANVADLMLIRGMERRREISLSIALGAQASRLVREALTESILLSLTGGAGGLGIARVGTRFILHFAFPPAGGTASIPINVSPSTSVVLFAFGVSLIAGVAFGIAPAWMTTRLDPMEALRGASRSTARTGSLPRKALVVFQAALSLVLLAASGLLTAALRNLENQDFGFAQDRRTIVRIDPSLVGYRLDQLTTLYGRIRDSLSSVPGVSAVAVCQYSALSGNNWGAGVWVDGHPVPGVNDDNSAFWDRVTAGYFNAIGTSIIKGRGISERDTPTAEHVAVINQAFARRYFKNETQSESILEVRKWDPPVYTKLWASSKTRAIWTSISTRRLARSFFCPRRSMTSCQKPERIAIRVRISSMILSSRPDRVPACLLRRSASYGFSRSKSADHFDWDSGRPSRRTIPSATFDCTSHLVLRSSFASLGLHRAVWSYCL
jgi:predicted permease